MPDHEPTGFELMRTMTDMRADLARQNDATNRRLDGLVSQVGLNEIIRRLDGKDSDNTKDIAKVDGKVDTLSTKLDTKISALSNRIWIVLATILLPTMFFFGPYLFGTPK